MNSCSWTFTCTTNSTSVLIAYSSNMRLKYHKDVSNDIFLYEDLCFFLFEFSGADGHLSVFSSSLSTVLINDNEIKVWLLKIRSIFEYYKQRVGYKE